MKVTTYTINEGTASPNNWKTKRGAINWAKKNGYEVEE